MNTSSIPSALPIGLSAGPSATTASMSASDKKKLKDSAVQLEATFTGYLMEELNKGLPGTSDNFSSEVYGDMFKQAIATKIAQSDSGSSMSNEIYNETLKIAARQHSRATGAADAGQGSASALAQGRSSPSMSPPPH